MYQKTIIYRNKGIITNPILDQIDPKNVAESLGAWHSDVLEVNR